MACGDATDTSFHSEWKYSPNRRWVGSDYWANRLQDWRVVTGRLECVAPLPLRTVHLVTQRLGDRAADFQLAMTFGAGSVSPGDSGRSSAGFLFGSGGGLDYRAASLIHHSHGPGAGIYAGVDTDGRAFLRDLERDGSTIIQTETPRGPFDSVSVRLSARFGDAAYEITMQAALWNATADTIRITTGGIPAGRVVGNVALVSDTRTPDGPTFWFSDFSVAGDKVERHDERAAGPILGTQHTLSRGTLKLTAQLMPLGPADGRLAALQVRDGRDWRTVATTEVVQPGYTATFTVRDWDDARDTPFRVAYRLARVGQEAVTHHVRGTVRRDPRDQEEIVVAAFTGNHNVQHGVERASFPWDSGVWFPHNDVVRGVRAHRPDFLFFSGDQVYEGASPTAADWVHPYEDYLYKWYLWYWAFGELTADIPAVTIPDDHDVFHGNVWGASGKATPSGLTGAAAQDRGGYKLPAEWVNMVQRTQTSHLPDPFDPTPVEQGIGVYYTDVLYGGVSFAVIEDRKFKSAPGPLLPRASVWNGWPRARGFDAATQADVPGASLLGERQLAFLEHWAADWSDGAWMKVVLSQTLFANVATLPDTALTGAVIPSLPVLPPGEYAEGERVVSDMDSNGWPQTGRNRALRAMRKAFAVHLAGDQHLASTIQYGVDDWRDAGYALCVPSIANFWPRRWYPPERGGNHVPGTPRYTGDFHDGFGNKITALAVSNPARTGREPRALHDRMPGYGIARFNRTRRTVSLAAWPRWADPGSDLPYPGWPVVFAQRNNYARAPAAYLPRLSIVGMRDPVVQIVDDGTAEIVYTLRISGTAFTPPVFAPGRYTIHVGEPAMTRMRTFAGVLSSPHPQGTLTVDLAVPHGNRP